MAILDTLLSIEQKLSTLSDVSALDASNDRADPFADRLVTDIYNATPGRSGLHTTTAIAIASSGGYVNTLIGTIIPLVPVILPYLAIGLLLFRRFVLSALTSGATLLVSPTRLAPLTALSYLKEDWHRTVLLLSENFWLSVLIIGTLLIVDISVFARAFGRLAVPTITLALLATAFLLPYILYVYPFPRMPGYYADFMRQPWLPAERIMMKPGYQPTRLATAPVWRHEHSHRSLGRRARGIRMELPEGNNI